MCGGGGKENIYVRLDTIGEIVGRVAKIVPKFIVHIQNTQLFDISHYSPF